MHFFSCTRVYSIVFFISMSAICLTLHFSHLQSISSSGVHSKGWGSVDLAYSDSPRRKLLEEDEEGSDSWRSRVKEKGETIFQEKKRAAIRAACYKEWWALTTTDKLGPNFQTLGIQEARMPANSRMGEEDWKNQRFFMKARSLPPELMFGMHKVPSIKNC